jgi:ribonuclease HII
MLLPFYSKGQIEAGTDEAGRGCLAGPVVAAAVILPPGFNNNKLRDSKKLNEADRLSLYEIIKEEALDFAISMVGPQRIDEINILNASIEAMHNCLHALKNDPEMILVDGNRFKPYKSVEFKCIIKGDDKYLSIAAASVLAKVSRDKFMKALAEEFPGYAWESNKGYPTKAHRMAIAEQGVTIHHRNSFRLLPLDQQGELFKKV